MTKGRSKKWMFGVEINFDDELTLKEARSRLQGLIDTKAPCPYKGIEKIYVANCTIGTIGEGYGG